MVNFENRVRDVISRADNLFPGRFSRLGGDITGGTDISGVGQPQADLVYADDGHYYETITEALANATEYVRPGPGSYPENITITTDKIVIEGSGRATKIDGGSSAPAFTIDAEDVTIQDLDADTDIASNQDTIDITANGSGALIKNVEGIVAGKSGIISDASASDVVVVECRIQNTDDRAIDLAGPDSRVDACYILTSVDDGIRVQGARSAIVHSYSLDHGNEGLEVEGDQSRCSGNTVDNVADNGILLQGNDSICSGNVVTNNDGDGIVVQGTDDVITGNRVGGNSGTDINTSGATTPTESGNNTGALN